VLLENNSNPDPKSGKWLTSAIYGTKVGGDKKRAEKAEETR